MAKHRVRVVESFRHTIMLGPLVLTGSKEQIAPPQERVIHYATDQVCEFNTKRDALAFCKAHGDKVTYEGKP